MMPYWPQPIRFRFFWPSLAISTPSNGKPETAAKAQPTAISKAAEEERPEPTGTSLVNTPSQPREIVAGLLEHDGHAFDVFRPAVSGYVGCCRREKSVGLGLLKGVAVGRADHRAVAGRSKRRGQWPWAGQNRHCNRCVRR